MRKDPHRKSQGEVISSAICSDLWPTLHDSLQHARRQLPCQPLLREASQCTGGQRKVPDVTVPLAHSQDLTMAVNGCVSEPETEKLQAHECLTAAVQFTS